MEEHLPLKVPGGKLPREWTGMSYLVDVVDGHYILKKKQLNCLRCLVTNTGQLTNIMECKLTTNELTDY